MLSLGYEYIYDKKQKTGDQLDHSVADGNDSEMDSKEYNSTQEMRETSQSSLASYHTAMSSGAVNQEEFEPRALKRSVSESEVTDVSNGSDSFTSGSGSIVPYIARGLLGIIDSSPKSISLNFDYRRRYSPSESDESSSCDLSSCSSPEIDSSDSERMVTFHKFVSTRKPVDFSKYVPIRSRNPLFVPKCSFHGVYSKEWQDTQRAYEIATARQNMGKGACKSKSETLSTFTENDNLIGIENRVKKTRMLGRCVPKILRRLKSTKSQFSKSSPDEVKLPSQYEDRFSMSLNERYLQLCIKERPNFKAILYGQISENPNYDLYHVKTELLVAALLNFFYPYINVQCLWVKNLQEKILQLTLGQIVTVKFNKPIHTKIYKAVLVLSSEASQLLRHSNTAFLQSIAAVMEISVCKIMVMVDENNHVL